MSKPKLNDLLPGLDPDDEHELCAVCGEAYGYPCCEVVREEDPCWSCGGAGDHDLYDEDPLWYEPGDTEACPECKGTGYIVRRVCIGGCKSGKPHKRVDFLKLKSTEATP